MNQELGVSGTQCGGELGEFLGLGESLEFWDILELGVLDLSFENLYKSFPTWGNLRFGDKISSGGAPGERKIPNPLKLHQTEGRECLSKLPSPNP